MVSFIQYYAAHKSNLIGRIAAIFHRQTVVCGTAGGNGNRQTAAFEIRGVCIDDRGRGINHHGAVTGGVFKGGAVERNYRTLVGRNLFKRNHLGRDFSGKNVQVVDDCRLVAVLAVNHRVLPGYQAVELEVSLGVGVLFG